MDVKIITDSTADIPQKRCAELGVECMPLTVRFGDKEYKDGVDLSAPQFFEMLSKSNRLPTTAQVNPERFAQAFSPYAKSGQEVVGIFISSRLSGTYQSAGIGKNLLGAQNIHLVDSETVTFGLALMVFEAVRMRDAGYSAKQICEALEALKPRLRFYAAFDSLKYLKMGGRLSASSAFVGTMLHIKPIISMKDGEMIAPDRKKGMRAAIEKIGTLIQRDKPDTEHPIVFGETAAPQVLSLLKETVAASADISGSETINIGSVVGTYAGPGCAGLAYIAAG